MTSVLNMSRCHNFLGALTTIIFYLAGQCCITSGEQGTCSRVTTYNTGLTPVVANMDNRIPAIVSALKQSKSDVLCLQEVWFERSLSTLLENLEDTFPYHYSVIHKKVGQLRSESNSWFSWLFPDVPCSKREAAYIIKDLGACAITSGCVGSDVNEVGGCLASKCKDVLKSRKLSQSCLSCILFSLSSLTSAMSECNRVVGSNNRMNGPGLVILSKKKIQSAKFYKFFPFFKLFVERGYIDAKVEDVGRVVCTHLSAHFGSYFEFDTFFNSYESQQKAEIRRLARFRLFSHILMGDLNTGPNIRFRNARSDVRAVYPDNFRRLMSYGYKDPYIHKVQLCTYCQYNSLVPGKESHILDHILYRGKGYTNVSTERVLTKYRGKTMSDHYGIEMSFCNA